MPVGQCYRYYADVGQCVLYGEKKIDDILDKSNKPDLSFMLVQNESQLVHICIVTVTLDN